LVWLLKKRLVILGAGYGGLLTAVELEEKVKSLDYVEIVLVDKNDYHQYLHLAYEIITDSKKVSDVTVPLNELLEKRKIQFFQATIQEIDLKNNVVKTNEGDLQYYWLVVALGSEPTFYRIKGAEEHSFCVSSVEAAAQIRDKLKGVLERDRNATIVVGGGGFTGAEVAGEILDEFKCRVTMVESSKGLLPSWHMPEFSRKVADLLTEMGAKIMLGKCIIEVKEGAIILDDGGQVDCSLFIWTGGVQASRVVSKSELKIGKNNRVKINEFCEAVGFPGVYVVGDCALVVNYKTGEIIPQCIEIALQQAETVAKNLYADLTGDKRSAFVPKFSGLILAVGEKFGIGKISGVKMEGRLAQMVKRIIHLQYVYKIAGLGKILKEIV
jgi:NADH dehydrogenase